MLGNRFGDVQCNDPRQMASRACSRQTLALGLRRLVFDNPEFR